MENSLGVKVVRNNNQPENAKKKKKKKKKKPQQNQKKKKKKKKRIRVKGIFSALFPYIPNGADKENLFNH